MPDSIGKVAEEILTAYYKQVKTDNSNYSLRDMAEMVAIEVANEAWKNSVEQDRLGESVYANDQFITPFFGLSLLTDVNGKFYVPMPNAPAGLVLQREVAYVGFTGNESAQVFPMRNKDRFNQQMQKTPKWMILYYVEGQNICFDNVPKGVTGPVDIKLVGAVPIGTELVNLPMNCPKNVQSAIINTILSRIIPVRNVLPDYVNDDVSK